MSELTVSSRKAGAAPLPPNPDPTIPGAHASLETLLAEVAALANLLRKKRALLPRQDDSPQGGWSILQTLGRLGPRTVPDIARSRALSRQNIQILVNRLESQGYVAVAPNPAHKRSCLVELTDRGRGLLATVIQREANSLESLLPHVPQTRLVPAARLLRRLRELLAGTALPPMAAPEEPPVPKPETMPRKPTRRRKATSDTAALSAAPESIEPDEGEFPLNLL
jgi:DNA-binding MarR family transcriptional regulator